MRYRFRRILRMNAAWRGIPRTPGRRDRNCGALVRRCRRLLACAAVLASAANMGAVTQAQTLTPIVRFDGADGSEPLPGLLQARNGDFYGATSSGGADGGGTIFSMTPGGSLDTLVNFNVVQGRGPKAVLMQAMDGTFYGTTGFGGASSKGSVFKMTPRGAVTILYSFCSQSGCADGELPQAALVQGVDGDFYGTTTSGGAGGEGTVYKISPAGSLTTLYSFCSQESCADGAQPEGVLIQGTDGNFYGTTSLGGALGDGSVFMLTTSGTLTTLYSFCSQSRCNDGGYPAAGVIQGSDGDFYETTLLGGANNDGTVFKITPSGTLTTLHSFDYTDGYKPIAGLVQASDGNFYGTTPFGGFDSNGTIYRITPDGGFTLLYEFCTGDCADGYYPVGRLVQAPSGRFYGVNENGGPDAYGNIFVFNAGVAPFIEAEPVSGLVGSRVQVLGTDLGGATSVTFNGVAATFTVVSGSEIRTAVPSGATSGTIEVTTPGGTLESNRKFAVIP